MTCAKQLAVATIITQCGKVFWGRNDALQPAQVCPRGDLPSGEGYALCRDVCRQPGHAEVMALHAAGHWAEGAVLVLSGHKAVCADCSAACDAAGIARIVVL